MTRSAPGVPPAVDAAYGWPDVKGGVAVPPGPLPRLLASAHVRVHGRPAAWWDGENAGVEGDLAAGRVEPAAPVVAALSAAERPVVLAGPGVVAAGAVPGLHALATAGSLGVLNTWGAKGVFDWRSRHHWATVGLQSRDYELGGLADADLIVATGLDDAESPAARWQLAPWVDVPPGALGVLAEQWSRPRRELEVPPLRERLAAVTQAGWARDAAPLAPTRVTRAYGSVLGAAGGMVAAEPGWAGYWVARTFPTTELGSAVVPGRREPVGVAAACALVARLRRPRRPVVLAVDAPVPGAVEAVLDLARTLGVPLAVEVWDPEGDALTADAHEARLAAVAAEPATVTLATDPRQLDDMVEAAGPVVAWGLQSG